jgi:hypothetical protein
MSTTYIPGIAELAEDSRGNGAWWLAVTRALDDLLDRLMHDAATEDGPSGTVAEALWTAPHLASAAARVRREREALRDRVRLLRRRVSAVAGDPTAVEQVAHELAAVAAEDAAYSRRSRELVWDSVSRDIGGE